MNNDQKFCKPELSKKNPYYISKHRFYQLKHMCLQYKEYTKSEDVLLGLYAALIQTATEQLPEWIRESILDAVTNNQTYEYLATYKGLPCCRDVYYRYYRQYFYELSEAINSHIRKMLLNDV